MDYARMIAAGYKECHCCGDAYADDDPCSCAFGMCEGMCILMANLEEGNYVVYESLMKVWRRYLPVLAPEVTELFAPIDWDWMNGMASIKFLNLLMDMEARSLFIWRWELTPCRSFLVLTFIRISHATSKNRARYFYWSLEVPYAIHNFCRLAMYDEVKPGDKMYVDVSFLINTSIPATKDKL